METAINTREFYNKKILKLEMPLEYFAPKMEDDAFCLEMYHKAKSDPDNSEGISIEQLARELGIVLE